MSPILQQYASVQVKVTTYMSDSKNIPKFVELFDSKLKTVRSKWYDSNDILLDKLEPGTYLLRLSLSSGVQKDEAFELGDGELKEIEINIANNSPHESHEWAYLSKNFTNDSFRDINMKNVAFHKEPGKMVNGKIWRYMNGFWESGLIHQFMNQPVRGDGYSFDLYTNNELSLLEISGENMPTLFVNLPPANNLKCLVKLAEVKDSYVHPIDVTVSTDNIKAETLLTLLNNNAVREAQTLANAEDAEWLLQQKFDNPVTAAIGGYYILKIGELERLHDWANNLANYFEWLPDGAIIHALQLLSEKNKSPQVIQQIKERLLQAVKRGLPVYTEGLRLLEKGLSLFWYDDNYKNDPLVRMAYEKIGRYLEASDCSQETLTFIGIFPDDPGRPPLRADQLPERRIIKKKNNAGRNLEKHDG